MTHSRVSGLNTSFQSDNILRDLFPEVLKELNSPPIDFKESKEHKLDANFQETFPSLYKLNLKQSANHPDKIRMIIDLTKEELTLISSDKVVSTPSIPIQTYFNYDLTPSLMISPTPMSSATTATTLFSPLQPSLIYNMPYGCVSQINYGLHSIPLPSQAFYPLQNQQEYLNNWHSGIPQPIFQHSPRLEKRKLTKLQAVEANKKQIKKSIEGVEESGKRLRTQSIQQQLPVTYDSDFPNNLPAFKKYAHDHPVKEHFSYDQMLKLMNIGNATEKLPKLLEEYNVLLKMAGFKHSQTFAIINSKDGLGKISTLLDYRFRIRQQHLDPLHTRYVQFITDMLTEEDGLKKFLAYMQEESRTSKSIIKQNSPIFFKISPEHSKSRKKSSTGVFPNQPGSFISSENRLLTLGQRGVNNTDISSTHSLPSSILASSSFLNNPQIKRAPVIKKEGEEEKHINTL